MKPFGGERGADTAGLDGANAGDATDGAGAARGRAGLPLRAVFWSVALAALGYIAHAPPRLRRTRGP